MSSYMKNTWLIVSSTHSPALITNTDHTRGEVTYPITLGVLLMEAHPPRPPKIMSSFSKTLGSFFLPSGQKSFFLEEKFLMHIGQILVFSLYIGGTQRPMRPWSHRQWGDREPHGALSISPSSLQGSQAPPLFHGSKMLPGLPSVNCRYSHSHHGNPRKPSTCPGFCPKGQVWPQAARKGRLPPPTPDPLPHPWRAGFLLWRIQGAGI